MIVCWGLSRRLIRVVYRHCILSGVIFPCLWWISLLCSKQHIVRSRERWEIDYSYRLPLIFVFHWREGAPLPKGCLNWKSNSHRLSNTEDTDNVHIEAVCSDGNGSVYLLVWWFFKIGCQWNINHVPSHNKQSKIYLYLYTLRWKSSNKQKALFKINVSIPPAIEQAWCGHLRDP